MNTFLMNFLPSLVNDQPNDASTSIRHLEENQSFHNVDFQLQDLGSLNDVEIQNLETFQNNFFISRTGNWLSKSSQKKKKTPEKKKRYSIILTDTPQKELLKSCKKVQKAEKRKAKNT